MINKIGIIGGGKMGTDIFYFLSGFAFRLVWIFKSPVKMETSREAWIKKQKRITKYNRLGEDEFQEKIQRVQFSDDLTLLTDCDLIIECINEDFVVKSKLFREVDAVVRPATIIVSNTSSIPINSLVPSELRRERFLGLHFFYPVRIKNLVEVNILPETSPYALSTISQFLHLTKKFHKILHLPNHFLFNRLFLPLQAGVFRIHEEDHIPVESLDKLIRENLFPIGIFEFFDQVGIDVMYTSISNYAVGYADPGFYQPLLDALKKLKEMHFLGVKTGKGFYDYSGNDISVQSKIKEAKEIANKEVVLKKIYSLYLLPVFEAVANSLLSAHEAEHIVMEYMGLDKSPFNLAKEFGFNPK